MSVMLGRSSGNRCRSFERHSLGSLEWKSTPLPLEGKELSQGNANKSACSLLSVH